MLSNCFVTPHAAADLTSLWMQRQSGVSLDLSTLTMIGLLVQPTTIRSHRTHENVMRPNENAGTTSTTMASMARLTMTLKDTTIDSTNDHSMTPSSEGPTLKKSGSANSSPVPTDMEVNIATLATCTATQTVCTWTQSRMSQRPGKHSSKQTMSNGHKKGPALILMWRELEEKRNRIYALPKCKLDLPVTQ